MKNVESQSFFCKQLDEVYSYLSASLSASLINSLILLYILWGKISSQVLLTWVLVLLLVLLFRIITFYFYQKTPKEDTSLRKWALLYFMGITSAGVLWGIVGILIFLSDSVPHQMFVAFVLGGMVAGAIASMSVIKYAFYCFSLPALLPISLNFLCCGDEMHLAMGVMILIFIVSSASMSHQMYSKSCKSIQNELEKDKEIEQRLKIEEQLREQQNKLERLVQARTGELTKANETLKEEIEERKNAEKELFQNREQFRTIIENIPEAIYRCELTAPWRVEHMSENIFPFTGYRAEEYMTGKLVYAEIIHPEDFDLVQKEVTEGVVNHKPYVIDYRIFHRDTSIRWVCERGQAYYDANGNPLWLDGVIVDITEQKQIQEELQRTHNIESLGALAGGIAHDFNNLLMGIFGNIEMAKDSLPSADPGYKFLEASLLSLDKAKSLTAQLLTFSRGGEPIVKATSLRELVEEAKKNNFQESHIKTTLDFSNDLWLVSIDQGQMNQVLHNLFTNAKEAMPAGGDLFIHAENCVIEENSTTLSQGKYVKISVRDEGGGIAPAILERIFDPYFSTKTKGAAKGTGMGLAVCHSIITKHKGHISVESTFAKGTTFTLLLPAAADAEKAAARENTTNKKATQAIGRILILEDEKEVSQVVALMLKRLGYESEIVADGRTAVNLYQKALHSTVPFGIVILDLTIHG
ncbi:MAG: PAS domain-containing protein, partial [Proteobacteria bacterium]|nr:PAS domain-containing protein [Pseudomonadota bacterium]